MKRNQTGKMDDHPMREAMLEDEEAFQDFDPP